MLKIRFTRHKRMTDDGIPVLDTEGPRAGLFLSNEDIASLLTGQGLEVELQELLQLEGEEPVRIGLFMGGTTDDDTLNNLKSQGAAVTTQPGEGPPDDDESDESDDTPEDA